MVSLQRLMLQCGLFVLALTIAQSASASKNYKTSSTPTSASKGDDKLPKIGEIMDGLSKFLSKSMTSKGKNGNSEESTEVSSIIAKVLKENLLTCVMEGLTTMFGCAKKEGIEKLSPCMEEFVSSTTVCIGETVEKVKLFAKIEEKH
ncbi:uncharacterized protein LOC141858076 [Brevipalpus obovatus]|uniref:uncharacterized protein LOC141858076 n=1 Tax=Brevipalpus obovatus TaxID=246614 RepID=UPI003D9EAB4C